MPLQLQWGVLWMLAVGVGGDSCAFGVHRGEGLGTLWNTELQKSFKESFREQRGNMGVWSLGSKSKESWQNSLCTKSSWSHCVLFKNTDICVCFVFCGVPQLPIRGNCRFSENTRALQTDVHICCFCVQMLLVIAAFIWFAFTLHWGLKSFAHAESKAKNIKARPLSKNKRVNICISCSLHGFGKQKSFWVQYSYQWDCLFLRGHRVVQKTSEGFHCEELQQEKWGKGLHSSIFVNGPNMSYVHSDTWIPF